MKKSLTALVLTLLLPASLLAQGSSQEERQRAKLADAANTPAFTGTLSPRPAPGGQPGTPAHVRASNGTIQYDDGVFNSIPIQPAGITDILSFGNQFDSQNGGTIPSPEITVNSIAVWPALIDGSSTSPGAAFITLFGPVNTAGTNASPISSNNYAGLTPQTWNTFPIANTGTVSPSTGPGTINSFLIGMFGAHGGSGTPCTGDCIGLSTGTNAGQGFHGMRVDDFSGGDFGLLSGFNAMIRPTGNVVPVELMTFSIE